MSTWIGKSVPRKEDSRLLTGRGTFVDDLRPLPNVHHAAILRSPHPHARILRVDPSQALRVPGVVAVLTPEDVRAWADPFPVGVEKPPKYYPSALDKVRFVGEPVAVVIARDRYLAEDARDLVEVEYEPLPAVVDPERALDPGAPLLHEELGSNVACHRRLRYGDPDQAFAGAEVVIRRRFRYPKYGSTPMETYGVVAAYDPLGESYTIWSNFQGPFTMHPVAARALRTPEHRVRFIVPQDSGGAFGIKTSMFPYIALVALAARKAEVPVKWIEDRQEHLLASSSGTDRVAEVELAANRDGTILGLRGRIYDNVGAYIRAPEPGCLFRPLGNYVGPYRFQHLDFDCYAVLTNKSLTGPNRGYGCGHLYLQTERLVDLLAEELGLDPAEVRRRNFIPPDAFPYTTPTGGIYDSGNYPAVLDRALELAGYDELRRQQQEARAQGRLFGIGIAATVDPSVSNMGYVTIAYRPETRARPGYLPKAGAAETGMVNVDSLGNVTAVVNTVPEGQGHETVVAQIVADRLGLDPKDVRVVTDFDTASRVWSISTGTYSSRFAAAGASATALAADRVRDKMVRIAAHLLEVAPEDIEVGNARFTVRGAPERSLSFRRIAGTAHWQPTALPAGMEVGLNGACVWNFVLARPPDEHDRVNSSQTYGFSLEIAAVEVDPKTGELDIKKLVSVHDAGRILNPLIVEGQVYGAIAHGLGGALFEEMAYDENGQFLSATLMDYLWPTAKDMPSVVMDHLETPSPFSLLGSKGIGESSTMSIPPLLANAVSDALKPLGVEANELPLSPNRVWSLLQPPYPSRDPSTGSGGADAPLLLSLSKDRGSEGNASQPASPGAPQP